MPTLSLCKFDINYHLSSSTLPGDHLCHSTPYPFVGNIRLNITAMHSYRIGLLVDWNIINILRYKWFLVFVYHYGNKQARNSHDSKRLPAIDIYVITRITSAILTLSPTLLSSYEFRLFWLLEEHNTTLKKFWIFPIQASLDFKVIFCGVEL